MTPPTLQRTITHTRCPCTRAGQLLNPDAPAAEEGARTGDWSARLAGVQKLLAVRAARREHLPLAVSEFVREHLGAVFIERPAIDLPTLSVRPGWLQSLCSGTGWRWRGHVRVQHLTQARTLIHTTAKLVYSSYK